MLHDEGAVRRGINRREVVRQLLKGVGAGFAGLSFPGVSASHPIHKHLASDSRLAEAEAQAAARDWTPQFLDPHQNETLIVLAERIVPGSTRAQVNRFIDLLLSVDTPQNQQKFINSLSAMDGESLNRFARPFKALPEAQQNEILNVASTLEFAEPQKDKDWSWFDVPSQESSGSPRMTLRDYFENLKGWISGAYYSSEIGMRELGWTGNSYYENFPGCQHPEGHH